MNLIQLLFIKNNISSIIKILKFKDIDDEHIGHSFIKNLSTYMICQKLILHLNFIIPFHTPF